MPDRTRLGETFANGWRSAVVPVRTVVTVTKRLRDRRLASITAVGIAAVIVAGAFAVGANLGILDASSDNEIGTLDAAGALVPTTDAAPAPATSVPAAPITTGARTYLVDAAGVVGVDAHGDALAVSSVGANPGWTWTAGPADATHVELTFTDGVRSLVFTATRAADGTVDAQVDEPASRAAPAATTTTPASSHDEADDHEDHEGRDDDD